MTIKATNTLAQNNAVVRKAIREARQSAALVNKQIKALLKTTEKSVEEIAKRIDDLAVAQKQLEDQTKAIAVAQRASAKAAAVESKNVGTGASKKAEAPAKSTKKVATKKAAAKPAAKKAAAKASRKPSPLKATKAAAVESTATRA